MVSSDLVTVRNCSNTSSGKPASELKQRCWKSPREQAEIDRREREGKLPVEDEEAEEGLLREEAGGHT